MSAIGLCVAKDCSIAPAMVSGLGAEWARWTGDPYYAPLQVAYAQDLHARGIKTFLTLDSDSYAQFGPITNGNTWRNALQWYFDRFGDVIDAMNPLNEPDGTGDESSALPLRVVNGIIDTARQVWQSNTEIVAVGSVSGQASYYDNINVNDLDGLDFHPYAKFPPVYQPKAGFRLADIIDEHKVYGVPLWISEIGVSSAQVGEEEQARFLLTTLAYLRDRQDIRAVFWFCAQPYNGFGLWREDGSLKPAGEEFKTLMGGVVELQYEYVLGFKEIADAHPDIVGEPYENERGIVPGNSFQETSNGRLYWAMIEGRGDTKGFISDFGEYYLWDGSQLVAV